MRTPVKFDRPPVVEVACGVLFASQQPIQTAHIGAFWDRVRTEFPRVEDAPPFATIVEEQGNAITEFEWSPLPPLRRAWLISNDGCHIIQIQQDRFLFNWKRNLEEDKYPSYNVVIGEFEKYLSHFLKFLDESGIGQPAYRQFDITYVNHITTANGLERVGVNNLLVDHIRSEKATRFLPEPEGFNWATSYPLPQDAGRLHIAAQSAVNTLNNEKIVRLDLIARGIPSDATEAGRRPWFDMAHEWITHGFADVTSDVLQNDNWKRTS